MAIAFAFPDVGEGIQEGEIVKWKVKEGDLVKQDQIVAEVETDKAIVELPSPAAGTILKLNFKQGQTVKVGETLLFIGKKGESISNVKKSEVKQEKKAETVMGVLEEADEEVKLTKKNVSKTVEHVLATPAIRALAKTEPFLIIRVSQYSNSRGERSMPFFTRSKSAFLCLRAFVNPKSAKR